MDRNYIETAKVVIEKLKDDKDVKDVLAEMGSMITDFTSGNTEALKAKLTGHADVDETLALVKGGQELRLRMQRRASVLNILTRLANIAVRFAPVLAEAKAEVKAKKKKG